MHHEKISQNFIFAWKSHTKFCLHKQTMQNFTCAWPEHSTIISYLTLKCNASAVVVVAEKLWIHRTCCDYLVAAACQDGSAWNERKASSHAVGLRVFTTSHGQKEAEVAEVKPSHSQNFPLHSKTAFNPYKFRHQKLIKEQQRQVSKATNSTSFQPPRHVQEISTQMETMKPRLSEIITEAPWRVLITILIRQSSERFAGSQPFVAQAYQSFVVHPTWNTELLPLSIYVQQRWIKIASLSKRCKWWATQITWCRFLHVTVARM